MTTVTLDQFFEGLGVVSARAFIDDNTSSSEEGRGRINRAAYGTRLWYGEVSVLPRSHSKMEAVEAKIQYLQEADVTFRITLPWRACLTARNGTVDAIGTDRRVVTLSEARPEGDVFGIEFGASLSMHRVVFVTGLAHTVVPALPLGVAALDVAVFDRPQIDAVVADPEFATFAGSSAGGTSFAWRQTY